MSPSQVVRSETRNLFRGDETRREKPPTQTVQALLVTQIGRDLATVESEVHDLMCKVHKLETAIGDLVGHVYCLKARQRNP